MTMLPRALYVDDDPDDSEMMAYWLREECGLDVMTAVDGASAHRLIDTEFFDIFILDYCLPDTTAVELCKRIRSNGTNSPIIVYSALDRPIDVHHASAAGSDLYLVKPDQIDELKPAVKRLLRWNRREAERTQKTVIPIDKNQVLASSGHIRTRRKYSSIT